MKVEQLGYYETGMAAFRTSQADRRFGYFFYLPEGFELDASEGYSLCVIVHGSSRTPHVYRDLFKDFADEHRCVVLAPMFPVGMTDAEDMSSYKFLEGGGIFYDRVLLAMVDELGERFGIDSERFLLHGFSGGGQFVHRFFYLHAHRLMALSIGAPGMVTLLDEALPWHRGVRGLPELMDRPIAWDAMRDVPVQLIIGQDDVETWEINIDETNRYWMPGVNDVGANRLERIEALESSLNAAGVRARRDEVPAVAHEGYKLVKEVQSFFAETLSRSSGKGRE